MAVYRSDQAQFTFAAGEGPPEAQLATPLPSGSTLTTTLTEATNPGDTVFVRIFLSDSSAAKATVKP